MTDLDLLDQFAKHEDQSAFAQVVGRHVDWVNSMARRLVRDEALAADVTQAVFILLSQKAGRIRGRAALSTWLFSATRYAALQALRMEVRRRKHERIAAAMRAQIVPVSDPSQWDDLSRMVDDLVNRLGRADRRAVLLRFYEQKSFPEIGVDMNISEEAARKRVTRAVERLREGFSSRGVTMSASVLGTTLAANLTQPASAATIAATNGISAGASGSAGLIAQGAGAMMVWGSIRTTAGVVLAVLIAIAGVAGLMQLGAGGSRQVAGGPTTSPTGALPTLPEGEPLQTQQAIALLDRLDERIARFGDHVAIITVSSLREDQTLNADLGAVIVLARRGERSLYRRYLTGKPEFADGRPRRGAVVPTPANWPRPSIKDVLDRVRETDPTMFATTEQNQVLYGMSDDLPLGRAIGDGARNWTAHSTYSQLPRLLWYGRDYLFGSFKETEIRQDQTSGLFIIKHTSNAGSREFIIMIDPKKDDLPTRTIDYSYREAGRALEMVLDTEFLGFERLRDGRQLPTRWRVRDFANVGGEMKEIHPKEYHLQVNTELNIDDAWFNVPKPWSAGLELEELKVNGR